MCLNISHYPLYVILACHSIRKEVITKTNAVEVVLPQGSDRANTGTGKVSWGVIVAGEDILINTFWIFLKILKNYSGSKILKTEKN